MALTKQDRISMSKKIIEISDANLSVDNNIQQILAQQQESIENDAVNAALQKPYNDIIKIYQPEYNRIDGNLRTEITEDLVNAAAKGDPRNGFFLVDFSFPIPSVPSGVWKAFAPMSFCYSIGKNVSENYDPIIGEEPSFNRMLEIMSAVEAYSVSARATGKKCTPRSFGSGSFAFNKDEIDNNLAIQALMVEFVKKANEWIEALKAEKEVIILTETVPGRLAENQIAYDEIDPTIQKIENWLTTRDFYRASRCPLSENWNSYPTVKFHPKSTEIISEIINERKAFLEIRKSQLNKYFGSIDQDLENGIINSFTGWYGERHLLLDSRLNIISGTANGKFGADVAIATQEQIKASNNTTAAAYSLNMKATKAVAPGLDTPYLNLKNADDFEVGNNVYVVADNQEELSGVILEKQGFRVRLSFLVPKKYNLINNTRLYKLIEKECECIKLAGQPSFKNPFLPIKPI
jgi:hypothetical protein